MEKCCSREAAGTVGSGLCRFFFNPQSKDVPDITRYVPARQVPLQWERALQYGVGAEYFGNKPQLVTAVQKKEDAKHNQGLNNLHSLRRSSDTVGFQSRCELVSTSLTTVSLQKPH